MKQLPAASQRFFAKPADNERRNSIKNIAIKCRKVSLAAVIFIMNIFCVILFKCTYADGGNAGDHSDDYDDA